MSLEEQLRNDAQSLREVGWFNRAIMMDAAANEIQELNERIKQLEEELERTKQDRNAIAKNTREPLLLKLDHAAERIKQLEEAGDEAIYKTNLFDREAHWFKAKEAKP